MACEIRNRRAHCRTAVASVVILQTRDVEFSNTLGAAGVRGVTFQRDHLSY